MSPKYKVASLFSGIGGFEQGFKKSNMKYNLVFASEIDKHATKTFSYNFSISNMTGDIKQVKEKDVPQHDLLCGGFPCQSFSVAGKQKGFNDIRGTLFFDVIRILRQKKPKYVLLENVKNLVSHDDGNTIKTILKNISDCGYTLDFTVINSSEAGVPQSRERTYIIGILNQISEKFEKDKRNNQVSNIKKWANENNLNTMNFFNNVKMNKKITYIKDILEENVDKKYYLNSEKVKEYISSIDKEKLSIKPQQKIIKEFTLPRDVHNDLDRQRRVYSIYGISPTLLARSDSPKIIFKENGEYRIRKLTPLETLRIQGFNKEFTDNIQKNGMSDTQLYKQSGNAVSPPVITEIINNLIEFIKKNNSKIRFIDLFCGLGGFRLALEKNNGECVFSSDIDKAVALVYEDNFGEYPSGDITKIDAKDIPDFDILCGGFPCQSFSIAGKRLGFEDSRGTMFFEVARILKEKKPKAFILENVKGITNHDNGKTLKTILDIIEELEYKCEYKVIKASDLGIPQNRERWYCVGIRKDLNIDLNSEEIFDLKREKEFRLDDIINPNENYEEYKISDTCKRNIQKHINKLKEKKSKYTLAYEIRASRCQFRADGNSPCLTAKMGTGGNNVPVIVELNRKLTERECLRLMGYPEDYKIGKGFQAYKQIGNSVVVPILEQISKNLLKILKNETIK